MNERAPRMSPDDRRTSLVQAATAVIRATGEPPTTKAVAEAAGVAEGTVFRAFPTKEAMLDAVVGAVVCPVPLESDMAAIDASLPLHDRLVAGTRLLMDRFADIFSVVGPLGVIGSPEHHAHPRCPWPDAPMPGQDGPSTLTRLLEPDATALRFDIAEVVQALRMLAFAGSHAHLAAGRLTDPEAIVGLVLDGARARDTDDREDTTC